MIRSLVEHCPDRFTIDVIDCGAHVLRRVGADEVEPLPDAWRGRLGGGTEFSFARFGPPELCGYHGRAVYLEADQLLLDDLDELAAIDLGDADLAAVPFAAARGDRPAFQSDGHLSSVVVFDNARCRGLSVPAVTDAVESGRLTYGEAISFSVPVLALAAVHIAPLPVRWNDLERRQRDTALLHYTDTSRQPWRRPGHPEGRRWRRAYVSCLREGGIDVATVDDAWRRGGVSRRVRTLARVPPRLAGAVDVAWQWCERIERRTTALVAMTRPHVGRVVRRARAAVRAVAGSSRARP